MIMEWNSYFQGEMQKSSIEQQTIPKPELPSAFYSVKLRQLIAEDFGIHFQSVMDRLDLCVAVTAIIY